MTSPTCVTRLRITQRARDDLRDIRTYSKATFGPQVARRYLLELNRSFASIRERPMAGRSEQDLGAGIRGMGFRSHRIFDGVSEQEIVIVRILHHARDVVSAWTTGR